MRLHELHRRDRLRRVSLIRSGEYDVLLSGGTDGCVLPGMIFGFSRMRAVSTRYNDRPRRRRGRSIAGATGSCSARARGCSCSSARIARGARRARLRAIEGYASTCDAYHRVQMDPDGDEIVRCIETALAKRGPAPEEIGYVNYHGTSTQLNDAIESRCVRRVFGATPIASRVVDQVDDRPSAGRQRRRRRRRDRAGADARASAADDQPRRSRSGVRHGLHPERRARRPTSTPRCATASGSDRRTARSCGGAAPASICCCSIARAPARARDDTGGRRRRAQSIADGRVGGVRHRRRDGRRSACARLVIAADGRHRSWRGARLDAICATPERWAFGAYFTASRDMTLAARCTSADGGTSASRRCRRRYQCLRRAPGLAGLRGLGQPPSDDDRRALRRMRIGCGDREARQVSPVTALGRWPSIRARPAAPASCSPAMRPASSTR